MSILLESRILELLAQSSLEELSNLGEIAIDPLIKIVMNPNPDYISDRAIKVLGDIGKTVTSEKLVDCLVKLLKSIKYKDDLGYPVTLAITNAAASNDMSGAIVPLMNLLLMTYVNTYVRDDIIALTNLTLCITIIGGPAIIPYLVALFNKHSFSDSCSLKRKELILEILGSKYLKCDKGELKAVVLGFYFNRKNGATTANDYTPSILKCLAKLYGPKLSPEIYILKHNFNYARDVGLSKIREKIHGILVFCKDLDPETIAKAREELGGIYSKFANYMREENRSKPTKMATAGIRKPKDHSLFRSLERIGRAVL